MSEDKNTALGSRARIGYSHVVPQRTTQPPQPATPMIAAALVLAALVLLTLADAAEMEQTPATTPVLIDDEPAPFNR